MLKSYRKEWDEIRGCWKDRPRHDIASHGADAFRYLAAAYRDLPPPQPPKDTTPRWAGDGRFTVDDLIALHGRSDVRIRVNARLVELILAVFRDNRGRRQERVWRAQRPGAKIYAIATSAGGRDRTPGI